MTVDFLRLVGFKADASYEQEVAFECGLGGDLSSHEYRILSATGLDAGDILFNNYGTTEFNGDYALLYEDAPRSRVITMKIGLNPLFSVQHDYGYLRDKIYKLISARPDPTVYLEFWTHNETSGMDLHSSIPGIITRVESELFGSEQIMSITLTCRDGMFTYPGYVEATVTASTEPNTYDVLVPKGNAPSGAYLTWVFGVNTSGCHISSGLSSPYGSSSVVHIDYDFEVGDILHTISYDNRPDVYVTRGGIPTYVADRMSLDSRLPRLYPGITSFLTYTNPIPGYPTTDMVLSTAEYKISYWGL